MDKEGYMETREYLKRYAWVYLYVAAFFLGAAGLLRHSVETSGPMEPLPVCPVIVIDAGHGAPDGELGASMRYLSQRYSMPFDELKGLLTDIGTSAMK